MILVQVHLHLAKSQTNPVNNIFMHYDPEANIISWEISEQGEIDHVLEFGSFVLHVTSSGRPALIEIVDASKFIGKMIRLKREKKEQRLAENV